MAQVRFQAGWIPRADVEEFDGRYELRVDLPGVAASDVDITLEAGILTLTGTRTVHESGDSVVQARRERGSGRFYRRFVLPDSVDAERITASSRDGVLEVIIPKQARLLPRKIEIAA